MADLNIARIFASLEELLFPTTPLESDQWSNPPPGRRIR